jgi:hypothetical protein
VVKTDAMETPHCLSVYVDAPVLSSLIRRIQLAMAYWSVSATGYKKASQAAKASKGRGGWNGPRPSAIDRDSFK